MCRLHEIMHMNHIAHLWTQDTEKDITVIYSIINSSILLLILLEISEPQFHHL